MRHSLAVALAALTGCSAIAQSYSQVGFRSSDGWTIWSPRPEIAPRGYVDPIHTRGQDGGSLALSGDSNPGVFGGWQRSVKGIEAGHWYRFEAAWTGDGLDYPANQVVARIDWIGPDGKRTGQPDYPWQSHPDGAWTRVAGDAQAPANAVSSCRRAASAVRAVPWSSSTRRRTDVISTSCS